MGPKRRSSGASGQVSRKRRKGLLGAAGAYDSEDDEDYSPSEPAPKPSRARKTKSQESFLVSDPEPDSSSGSEDSASEAAACASSNCEDGGGATSDGDTTDGAETLAARQARLRKEHASTAAAAAAAAASTGRGRARGRGLATAGGLAGTAAGGPQQPATGWDQLPTSVLAKVFLQVCAAGALPMAPRLACVCNSWAAAAAETPELWRTLDTRHLPAAGHAAGSCKRPTGKRKRVSGAAQKGYTADEGLASWLAAGRLRKLQELRISCAGSSHLSLEDPVFFEDADAAAAAGSGGSASSVGGLLGGGCAEIGGQVLLLLAQGCQHLRRVTFSGAPAFRAEEMSSALLAMPLLSELRLSGLRITPVAGLDAAVRRVLDAAAATGTPALTRLVLESCPMVGKKTIRALCQPSRPAAPTATAGADAGNQEQAAAPPVEAAAHGAVEMHPHAALPPGPAFPGLLELDLSCCCSAIGGGIELHLEGMQAAMPLLRVLKLSGLGGFYGFRATARSAASLPGFPHLRTLHVGCALLQLPSGLLRAGTSYVTDALLLNIAGKSPNLVDLDVSGAHVSRQGLLALAAALAEAGGCSSRSDAGTSACSAVEAEAAAGGADEDQDEEQCLPGSLPLQRLYINRCSKLACDEGLLLVGQLTGASLQELVVRNAGATVGDDGLRGLAGCTGLNTLDVTGSSVTESGLRELLCALPGLEELQLGSCRSISRAARQAAGAGVQQLQRHLREAAAAEQPAHRRRGR